MIVFDASISARDIMPTMRQSAMLFSLQYVISAVIDDARTLLHLRPILISKTFIALRFLLFPRREMRRG